MKAHFVTLFLVTSSICLAQGKYDVALIPDSLLKGANVVKRIDETIFTVKALDKIVEYSKVAYTILNEKGDDYGYLAEGYDKLQSINTFDATLFDARGNKIRGVKRNELKDESAVSGMNLMDDSRYKWYNFYHKVYPYTVEFEVETESKNTLFFPTWLPVNNDRMGVVQSSLTVYCPLDYELRYKLTGGAVEPTKTEIKNEKIYKWGYQNQKPVLKEPYSISFYDYMPTVKLAPSRFIVQGYEGDMNSWESFGNFNLQLNAGRDVLPDNIREEVIRIAAPLATSREKIEAIYKYLQNNTRYISVQLGIGGWQTFDAAYVAKNKYGDCKALSNYMVSMLKAVGVESYYTVIKAGEGANEKRFLNDFTSNSFNHVIVCVPNNKDTVWLECTSQQQYPGYMSDFTDDRYAFLITSEGGKIVKTPRYGLNENIQVRKINAKIDELGDMTIKANTFYQAQQQDNLYGMIKGLSKDRVNEILKTRLDLPNYDLINYDYKPSMQKLPVIEENLEIKAMLYAQVSGKRMFLLPNIMNRSSFKPPADSTRKYPIYFDFEYRDIDSTTIEIPAGYKSEALPKDASFSSVFGNYKSEVKVAGNKIYYTRKIERFSGTFPASAYPDLVKFWEQVNKADRAKLVMVKQE